MNRLLRSMLIVASAILPAVSAYAGEPVFHGRWQQVDSNAGRCETCLIAIVKHGEILTVTSNNGWSAVMQADRLGHALLAAGKGQWQDTASAVYSNAPFDLGFVRKDEQLYMLMMVKSNDGTTNAIRAVFGQPVPAAGKHRGWPPVSKTSFSSLMHSGQPR
jgi:hypothetical protein